MTYAAVITDLLVGVLPAISVRHRLRLLRAFFNSFGLNANRGRTSIPVLKTATNEKEGRPKPLFTIAKLLTSRTEAEQ